MQMQRSSFVRTIALRAYCQLYYCGLSTLNFSNLLDLCEHQDSISHANGCDGRLHAALEPLLCNVTRSFTERIFALKLLHQKDCSVI